jgi:hypothetical protein
MAIAAKVLDATVRLNEMEPISLDGRRNRPSRLG